MTKSLNQDLFADYESDGKIYKFRYYETDTYDDLERKTIRQVYGVCFWGDKMVIVKNGKKGTWGLVGGKPEDEETIEETLIREVQEESNMKVLDWKPIGVQEVTNPEGKISYQLRVACLVQPWGDFVADPAGTISEIKLIDPQKYKEYFDWGEIGEKIITRAIDLYHTK